MRFKEGAKERDVGVLPHREEDIRLGRSGGNVNQGKTVPWPFANRYICESVRHRTHGRRDITVPPETGVRKVCGSFTAD